MDCGDSPGEEGRQGQAGWSRVEDRGVPGGTYILREEELRWEKPHLARQQPRSSGDSGARRHTGLQTLKKPVTHPLAQGSGGATDKTAAVVAVS